MSLCMNIRCHLMREHSPDECGWPVERETKHEPVTPPRFTPAEMREMADLVMNGEACRPMPNIAAMLRQAAETQEKVEKLAEFLKAAEVESRRRMHESAAANWQPGEDISRAKMLMAVDALYEMQIRGLLALPGSPETPKEQV